MKIYFHLCIEEFTNCYIVVNDDPLYKSAVIIDPGKFTNEMIAQLEEGGYSLDAVLITHNHKNHVKGLSTIMKIYSPQIYAADYDVAGEKTELINGDGEFTAAGLKIKYYSLPGHSPDSMVYQIGSVFFTGDTLLSGTVGETNSKYSKRMLVTNIQNKILSQTDDLVLMPGHGPPSTIGCEKRCNIDLS
jgi:hydroxyacylglutathione hydrolase